MPDQRSSRSDPIASTRLWFGFTGSACAFTGLAVADVLIAWWACLQNDAQFGFSHERPGINALYFAANFLLMGVAAIAGSTSYLNWKKLSASTKLLNAEARGRQEFMALLGVFVSVTLGVGIVWLTIPLFLIGVCVRAR